jgi:hypothetical protein
MERFGFVKEIRGVGAATIASVKYDEVFGGQLHSEIPFPVITVTIFEQDWQCDHLESSIGRKSKRLRSQTATIPVMPSPVKKRKQNAKQEPVRKEPPTEKLVMRLRTGPVIWRKGDLYLVVDCCVTGSSHVTSDV